jgi:hypothetical protein
MQAAIEIPTPNESDSDTVVTALETAAVFSAKGDTAEAIRWLQRAAESAGEAGDDMRTLTLARTAADLTRSLQSAPASEPEQRTGTESAGAKRLPKPPPRQSSSMKAVSSPSGEEESQVISAKPSDSGSRTPLPSAVQATSTRPPPPSARVLPSTPVRPASGASGVAGTASVAPRPSVVGSKSSIPSAERRRTNSFTPAPSSVAPRLASSRVEASPSNGESADSLDRKEPRESAAATAPKPPELPTAEVPSAGTDAAPASANGQATAPSNGSVRPSLSLRPPEQTNVNQRLRAAARVSVVPSSTEPGLFFVRVLDDGQSAPSSSTEALMVLLDPSSTLFSG